MYNNFFYYFRSMQLEASPIDLFVTQISHRIYSKPLQNYASPSKSAFGKYKPQGFFLKSYGITVITFKRFVISFTYR